MKWLIVIMIALLLTGCGEPEEFETMSDSYVEQTLPQAQETSFWLPAGATMTTGQVFASGDMDATLRSVTGFDTERLELIQRKTDQGTRSECAWACVGESGDQVARTLVLDDGYYHYVLTVMAPAENAADLAVTWQDVFNSFRLGEEKSDK